MLPQRGWPPDRTCMQGLQEELDKLKERAAAGSNAALEAQLQALRRTVRCTVWFQSFLRCFPVCSQAQGGFIWTSHVNSKLKIDASIIIASPCQSCT